MTTTIDRSADITQPLDKLGPDETLKFNSDYLRGKIVLRPARPHHRRRDLREQQAHEVPRDLPAGRPRYPRRAAPAEAGAGADLHGPRPPARRRLHARAMAEDRRACAGAWRQHDPPDDAPDLPVPLDRQGRHQADDPGAARRAARYDRGLRRRRARRDGDGRSAGFRRRSRSRGAVETAQRSRHPEHAGLSRDLVRQGTRGDVGGRRAALRADLPAA